MLIATMGIVLLVLMMVLQDHGGHRDITVDEAQAMMEEDKTIVLLDVRTPLEFAGPSGHLEGAILIPIQELEQRLGELEPFKDRMIIAYCRTGNRSGTAATILTRRGYQAVNMDGGIVQWNKQQLPVVIGKE